jgi:hypothetical protein
MKYLSTYKIFESKKETEDIIKSVMSNLPNGFYYRAKYNRGRGSNDRSIASAIDEHSDVNITITRLEGDDVKTWSVDKREIPVKNYKRFMFKDVKSVIEDLLSKLPNYRIANDRGKYTGYISNNNTIIGDDSWGRFNDSQYIKLSFEIRINNIPSFRNTATSLDDRELRDIFLDVFDEWDSTLNIKEAGDYYKIMSINNGSPYDITPMTDPVKYNLIESINRVDSAFNCDLISSSFIYRDNSEKYLNREFAVKNKGFNYSDIKRNKELSIEFIKDNDIVGFTIIYKKRNIE